MVTTPPGAGVGVVGGLPIPIHPPPPPLIQIQDSTLNREQNQAQDRVMGMDWISDEWQRTMDLEKALEEALALLQHHTQHWNGFGKDPGPQIDGLRAVLEKK